jgi:hypothetical protein
MSAQHDMVNTEQLQKCKAEVARLRVGIEESLNLLSDGPGGPLRISAMKLLQELLNER